MRPLHCRLARTLPSPYLYVGITHNSPERRFEIHKAGGRSSSEIVYLHGVRLRPDLYRHYKKVRERDGAAYEQDAADDLRAKGYVVDSGGYGFFWQNLRR